MATQSLPQQQKKCLHRLCKAICIPHQPQGCVHSVLSLRFFAQHSTLSIHFSNKRNMVIVMMMTIVTVTVIVIAFNGRFCRFLTS